MSRTALRVRESPLHSALLPVYSVKWELNTPGVGGRTTDVSRCCQDLPSFSTVNPSSLDSSWAQAKTGQLDTV